MLPTDQGAFRLFTAAGIRVSLHWSWFLVAYWQFQRGKDTYEHPVWMVWEYLVLFAIVLMHEFGHSLACRSVGGSADRIILWPFGGIAFVQPPPRPGAFLWSIAAGPLVNVALIPVIFAVRYFAAGAGLAPVGTDVRQFLDMIWQINLTLLIFNILPIYPLDGGQIFQSVLWFFVGQMKSIIIAATIGIVCAAAAAVFGFLTGSFWLGLIALFLISQSWRSLQWAREMQKNQSAGRGDPVIDI